MAERKYKNPQVNLRLPAELKDSIANLATLKGRSANAEMIEAIAYWVSIEEAKYTQKRTEPSNQAIDLSIDTEKLHMLDKDDLIEILDVQNNILKQYQNTLATIRDKTEAAISEIKTGDKTKSDK